jgi:hypothetical protein
VGSSECSNEPASFTKCREEFPDNVSDYQLFRRNLLHGVKFNSHGTGFENV